VEIMAAVILSAVADTQLLADLSVVTTADTAVDLSVVTTVDTAVDLSVVTTVDTAADLSVVTTVDTAVDLSVVTTADTAVDLSAAVMVTADLLVALDIPATTGAHTAAVSATDTLWATTVTPFLRDMSTTSIMQMIA
jgi:hypothetical protein